MTNSVFRAGVSPNMSGMSVVYIALEKIQPEQIFQHNELSQAPNKERFTRSTSNTTNWKNQSFNIKRLELYAGLPPDLDLPKKKMASLGKFFLVCGDSSCSKISQWDSELLIFTKQSRSLMLTQDGPRVAGAVEDTLLHLHYEQLNLK